MSKPTVASLEARIVELEAKCSIAMIRSEHLESALNDAIGKFTDLTEKLTFIETGIKEAIAEEKAKAKPTLMQRELEREAPRVNVPVDVAARRAAMAAARKAAMESGACVKASF